MTSQMVETRLTTNTPACFSGRQPQQVRQWNLPKSHRRSRTSQVICFAYETGLIRSRFPGFSEEDAQPLQDLVEQKTLITPESASWGLSVPQMRAMGITSESEKQNNLDPVSCSSLRKRGFLRHADASRAL